VADRALVHAVPRDPGVELGASVLAAAVAGLVGRGATRLPLAPPQPLLGVPPVLPLALASLVGVWAGVPETSAALLAAGGLGGLAVVVAARRLVLTLPGAVVVSMAPVAAALVGAVGWAQALVGGCLCSATFVVLVFGPRLRSISAPALVRGTSLHFVAAVIAARQIAVHRGWGLALLWVPVVIALAVAATKQLRRS
jgi:hypothetical protein